MKKLALFIAMGLCVASLSACSNNGSANVGGSDGPTAILVTENDGNNGADEGGNSAADVVSAAGEGYVFDSNGAAIAPDMLSEVFLNACGEPMHYYESKSCAFEGLDKVYTYPSYEITTYPVGEEDYVASIVLKDDTITTKEGAYISMNKDVVLEKYGDDYTVKNGAYIYAKGGMELRFIFDANDACISIEYASTALQ